MEKLLTNRFNPTIQDNELLKLHNNFCQFSLLEKGYSPNTIRNYKYSLKTLLKFFDLHTIEEINEGVMRQFLYRGQQEKSWSKHAVLQHRKNLSPFFQWCVKKHYLVINPFDSIEKPRVISKIPESFTEIEIQQITYCVRETFYQSEFLRKRNYAAIALLLMTGVRKGELLGLNLLDINFDENVIKVKGQTSKSKKDRIVPMPHRLKEILVDYLKERKKLRKTSISLLTSYNRDTRFTESGLKILLKKLQQDTKIYIHTHKFRHTFATKCLESGVDLETLKEFLGHKSIKTTAIYLHTTVKHLKKELEKNKINCLI